MDPISGKTIENRESEDVFVIMDSCKKEKEVALVNRVWDNKGYTKNIEVSLMSRMGEGILDDKKQGKCSCDEGMDDVVAESVELY